MKINGFEWHNKKVLVTGASGLVGAWISAVLTEIGAQVYGTVRNQINPNSAYHAFRLGERIVPIHIDITDLKQVSEMINRIEPHVIIHQAAKALVTVSNRAPLVTFQANVAGTVNLLECLRTLGLVERLICASTDHVFGSAAAEGEPATSEEAVLPPKGFSEMAHLGFSGVYDTSKSMMELAIRSYHKTFWNTMPALGITRSANIYGAGDTNVRRVIPLFAAAAAANQPIPLKYRKNGRQFLYISDAVAGFLRAVGALDEHGGKPRSAAGAVCPWTRSPFTPTFHFANERYSSKPYIRMSALAKLTASTVGGHVVETADCVDYAANENKIQALNCAATRAVLGWEPKVPIEEGLRRVGDWYRVLGDREKMTRYLQREVEDIVTSLESSAVAAGSQA